MVLFLSFALGLGVYFWNCELLDHHLLLLLSVNPGTSSFNAAPKPPSTIMLMCRQCSDEGVVIQLLRLLSEVDATCAQAPSQSFYNALA